MKTTEFMVALGAMCKEYTSDTPCTNEKSEVCPLHNYNCDITVGLSPKESEDIQAIVERWARGKGQTNAQKFMEVFGLEAVDFWSLCDVNAEKWMQQPYEN